VYFGAMSGITRLPPKVAVLSEETKSRVREHMGYLDVSSATTYGLGVPILVHPLFAIENSMTQLNIHSVPRLMKFLARLDDIMNQVFCNSDLNEISSIGEITVDEKRLRKLASTYKIAQQGLANLLGCPVNPYDMREWLKGCSGGINVPVL
jgi:hypothetical protein